MRTDEPDITPEIEVRDLGRSPYAAAYQAQVERLDAIVRSRESPRPIAGVILLVEHDPVITVSRRAGAASNVLATPEALAQAGVEIAETDRGGDVTYHGPGQLVAYPIIDLNAHALRIIDYIRLLEAAILDALGTFGVRAHTDPAATGVWVSHTPDQADAKIAAIGVRVRQWVSMHGLSINVDPNMAHFGLLVPCGLHGRPVTSLARVLGGRVPSMEAVKAAVVSALRERLAERFRARTRPAAPPSPLN